MKRMIFATIALVMTVCASAQQWEQTTPDVRVYLMIEGGDPANLTLDVCFINELSEPMSGLECTIDLPEGIIVSRNTSGGEALNSGHMYMKNIYEHSRQDDTNSWLFTCFSRAADVDAKQFRSDGRVATLLLDASNLSEGTYNIGLRNALVVWTDGYNVTQLKTADVGYEFVVKEDYAGGPVPTDVKGVMEEDAQHIVAPAQRGIYTLQGVKVDSTEPGRIYIVNGRKVLMK